MISSFKSMTGLWPEVDPPDCEWMKLQQVDKNTGEATPKGEICYSIQIWPKVRWKKFISSSVCSVHFRPLGFCM